MFVIASKTFYDTADSVVFQAKSDNNTIRQKDDFDLNQKTFDPISNETKVKFFSDGKQISINLNDETLNLLQQYFSKDDFINLSDGSIGLSGNANAYVDGWFKDIMIDRNFANADKNSDGKISKDETSELKNFVKDTYKVQDLRDLGQIVLRKATNSIGYETSQDTKPTSLQEILENTINSDKNFDGKLSRLEYASNGKDLENGYNNMAKDAIKKLLKTDDITSMKMVIDPTGKTMSKMNGKSMSEIEKHFGASNGSAFNIENLKIGNLNYSKEDEKEELLRKFPEFRAIIENNPNISQKDIESLKNKSKNIDIYKKDDNSFDKKFIHSLLKIDMQG